jgi:3-oxoacyl-[acyl-carrier-protein] synthase I
MAAPQSGKMKNPAYLNTMGMVNALGRGIDDVYEAVRAGSQEGIKQRSDLIYGKDVWVGEINGDLPRIGAEFSEYNCRNNRILLEAFNQIRKEFEKYAGKYGKNRIAVILGATTAGIAEGEDALAYHAQHHKFPADFSYKMQELGSPAQFLAKYLGLTNVAYSISTACSSSAHVFASGRNLLEKNICDAVIVGGVDSLCKLTLNGFNSLEALSKSVCNPFSANRDGITIGEAAALFILSREESEISLLGVGASNDAHHISSPEPEGRGAEIAIRSALREAQLAPADIAYVNLHGTGTELNDSMESQVNSRVFEKQTWFSSTKPLTGHTLGAAGATEVGMCYLSLIKAADVAVLPPHIWDGQFDENLPRINLVSQAQTIPATGNLNFLSASYGFGGNNAAVIISKGR